MPIFLLTAFSWIRNSTFGRYAAIIVGAFMAILFARAMWRHQGAKDAEAKLRSKADAAAANRNAQRAEIDQNVRRAGSAERLKEGWSRD